MYKLEAFDIFRTYVPGMPPIVDLFIGKMCVTVMPNAVVTEFVNVGEQEATAFLGIMHGMN